MFNEADMAALARALEKLRITEPALLVTEVAAALDAAGVTGLIHNNEPKEAEGNQSFFARVTVELEIRAPTPERAWEWVEEHSVFDMLDRDAEVGEMSLHDMNGEDVTP